MRILTTVCYCELILAKPLGLKTNNRPVGRRAGGYGSVWVGSELSVAESP